MDGRLLAAGQYAVLGRTCLLCWLAADPGEPGVLEDLLAGLEDLARGQGCAEIIQSRNELGVGWFGTPVVWDHVVRGLGESGWKADERWLIMTAGTEAAAGGPAKPPFRTLRLDRRENPAAPEWSADVRIGDVPAAECNVWGVPALFRDCPGYGTWTTVESIDVEEPFLRQGVGRWLMGEQMRWLAGRGVQNVLLFTENGNLPARRLFESLGFTAGPECWCLGRSLDAHPGVI